MNDKAAEIHRENLRLSTHLSSMKYMDFTAPGNMRRACELTPAEVCKVLLDGKVRFVLVGAHGIVGWTRTPRATIDVDVVVPLRSHRKAVRLLHFAFPDLRVVETPIVTRFMRGEREEIDVIRPQSQLYTAAFKCSMSFTDEGLTYPVPTVEFALAAKFAAAISGHRAREKRMQDMVDFIRMVKANPSCKLRKLRSLGELIYPGGGAEVLQYLDLIKRDQPLPPI